ncbi:MAG: hypothetical protein HYY20_01465 [Candidatus Tectomicrobia bacterium]|uniref:Uncharacterized protein n=1 Tax=Tectimicrobiota bacterium TaxID=2528274 RepID=A0A932FZM7_UNCTE|nr:hypothetical protein [Candidatus Tectomicrobia bacterium]
MGGWKGWPLGLLLVALQISGCVAMERPYRWPVGIGSERIVEQSHLSVPRWILRRPEGQDSLYYVGGSTDARSLSIGRDLAYMNALVQLVNSLGVVFRVGSQAQFTNLDSFLHQSIKGIPMWVLSKRAEIGEVFFRKKEVVREVEYDGYYNQHIPTRFDVVYEVWVLVKYPKEEWTQYQQKF